jgi:hypothetical protein
MELWRSACYSKQRLMPRALISAMDNQCGQDLVKLLIIVSKAGDPKGWYSIHIIWLSISFCWPIAGSAIMMGISRYIMSCDSVVGTTY